jgi:hypothetical protein
VSASDARSWFPADIDRTATAPVAGPVPGGELIHQRAYEIGSYFEDDDHFRLVGHVRDVKPDGMWGIQDTEPMVVHHMELHLVVHAATMTITQVFTKMHVTPQLQCVDIEASYQQLVGVSVARGFTNKVKELFGGPRGCTHIGALTNAMAPVAMQSLWAFFHRRHDAAALDPNGGAEGALSVATSMTDEQRRQIREVEFGRNRNTCHVWAEDGPMYDLIARGEPVPLPKWGQERLRRHGVDPEKFARF